MNIQKTICALLVAALAGCGSQEEAAVDPTTTNTVPEIKLEKQSITVEEGVVVEVPFSAIDAETPYQNLSFSIDNTGQPEGSGVFEIDVANKKFIYRAPWLVADKKTIDTAAQLVVTDAAGGKRSDRLSVKVTDKNSIVQLKVLPPAQGFGFERTQTDKVLNLFVMESQSDVVFQYVATEDDADSLAVDFKVAPNKYVFTNDVSASIKENGFHLSVKVPNIDEASSQLTLQGIVTDNDGSAEAIANITIVNDVKLQWSSGNPSMISEKNGAVLKYVTSEKNTYPAAVSVTVTDQNGKPLATDVPFVHDRANQTITFPPQPALLGDQTRLVSIVFSNEVKNAAGESYVAKSTLSAPFVFKDDRDDSFEEQMALFNKQIEWVKNLAVRADESRVGGVVAKHLFLKGLLSDVDASNLHSGSEQLFMDEMNALQVLAEKTSKVVAQSSAGTAQEKLDALSAFDVAFRKTGEKTRAFIFNTLNPVILANGEQIVRIKPVSVAGEFSTLNGGTMVSNYVGNPRYGQYADPQKKEWSYYPGYEYLDVVDITDNYCF